ncbi:hypothetical protein Lesp02_75930 [Lentzea sp. NBRC 105346]|uniref:Imm10 family immunity protein n=1 Tax=Lentzea sp. NBRC 105346 TaxID=3032205 RepID=UPI0024A18206|nr:Imm10 family immunity protein [Lentzea sp. NBRC 105346]GLZ35406.1 hypothetical protein Lesp02_75930 [Lentzea sp. NBRC 105346]
MSFTVRDFGVDDDDIYTVGVAELPDGGGRQLLFMTSEDDVDDADQGMDTYCITDERGACVYGGVRRADLSGNVLRLELTDQAARDLQVDPVVELVLELEPVRREALRAALPRVLSFGRQAFRPELTGDFG